MVEPPHIATALALAWSHVKVTWEVPDEQGACISATRVGIEVLQRLGLKAKPFPCQLTVANLAAVRLIFDRVPVEEWPDEAWSLGVFARSDGDRLWNAHLAIEWWAKETRGLCDLDLARYARPEHGVIARATSLRVPKGLEDIWCPTPAGAFVHWEARRDLSTFKKTPMWREQPPTGLIDALVDAVREIELDETATPATNWAKFLANLTPG